MSSTIYYKGTLKDTRCAEDLYEAVRRQSATLNCKIVRSGNDFYIEFAGGASEPLLFRLNDGKVNWFFKWHNPANPDEYFRIFDLFIAIKPLFKSLRIDDDEGVWQEYLLKSTPCKIHLRQLSGPAELSLLEKNFKASDYDLTRFMMPGMMFLPYSNIVYCVIARDFLRIFNTDSVTALDKDRILNLANKLRIDDQLFTHENFAFMFPYMLVQIWIGCCLAYKIEGRVCGLPDAVRGLKTNRLAAEFGLLSTFLNIHSGTVNYKHAEIKRFAARHMMNTAPKLADNSKQAKAALTKLFRSYITENNIDTQSGGPVLIPLTGSFKDAFEAITDSCKPAPGIRTDEAKQSLEELVSILDYLGFKYIGPDEAKSIDM